MKKVVMWSTTTLGLMLVWATLSYLSTFQGWFLQSLAEPGDKTGMMAALKQEVEQNYQGNLSLMLVENGEYGGSIHVSKGRAVDQGSIFGVSSLGKWVAAVGVMKLVERGKLELDAPVENYLTRWHLPPSEFDNSAVTVRRLLSHTAGITDGLGHNGFEPGEPVQPLVEHLTQAKDAESDVSGRVEVGLPPGEQWKYSGGSYNLLQLVVEEVSGQSFESFMAQQVFSPLNMKHTGYRVDRASSEVAEYFGKGGELQVYPNYTSLAATGLYTSANDLLKFVQAQIPESNLSHSTKRLLTDGSLNVISEPHAEVNGLPIWGAGPMLFAENGTGGYIIGHGGRSPRLNATARLNPSTGNGIIVLQTGNEEALASDLATHWTLWETGRPDMYMLKQLIPTMLINIVIGCLFILFVSISLAVVRYKMRKHARS